MKSLGWDHLNQWYEVMKANILIDSSTNLATYRMFGISTAFIKTTKMTNHTTFFKADRLAAFRACFTKQCIFPVC